EVAAGALRGSRSLSSAGPLRAGPVGSPLGVTVNYSTFSTNTRMVPPQESPTFQAVSSATPNSSIFGLPLSITSSASVTTAPSTQPPDTDPRKLPSLSITRFEPVGRGAEPQVSTTVASATPRPSFRQSSAALRISSSRESIGHLHRRARTLLAGPPLKMVCRGRPGNDQKDLRHLVKPCLGITATRRYSRQCAHKFAHGFKIMDRPQFVNVRQNRLDAFRARL